MVSVVEANEASGDVETALNEEQRRLLGLLARGLSVTEAARALHLSPRTAQRRLAEARASLGAATNAEAVLRAEGQELGTQSDGLSSREREVLELVGAGLRDDGDRRSPEDRSLDGGEAAQVIHGEVRRPHKSRGGGEVGRNQG
jgi:DNA-binding CsgD family transcriptional regulator